MKSVFIKMKSVGKRRGLEPVEYTLPDGITSLRELIAQTVRIEVDKYNGKESGAVLLPFLSEDEIMEKCMVGKVGFGSIYSEKKADTQRAIEVAMLAFEDGLFRVLVNDSEIKELDDTVELKNGDTITFIRLTFLAGRLW